MAALGTDTDRYRFAFVHASTWADDIKEEAAPIAVILRWLADGVQKSTLAGC